MTTISSLRRLSPQQLHNLLLDQQQSQSQSQSQSQPQTQPTPRSLAIIDVRDDDHIGGHIRTSTHVPSLSLDARMPELLRSLRGVDKVVFHCSLSQQRGPGAALGYLRERVEGKGDGKEDGKEQEVFVLDGGFVKWQELYGEDEKVTEGWVRDIWRDE
ncbi:MAG: hypothetical protein M1833_004005 [Piccolia ochrophora]|nr:MAG: hypothetical protein M1833_004005 [Piccolia ochrophora]